MPKAHTVNPYMLLTDSTFLCWAYYHFFLYLFNENKRLRRNSQNSKVCIGPLLKNPLRTHICMMQSLISLYNVVILHTYIRKLFSLSLQKLFWLSLWDVDHPHFFHNKTVLNPDINIIPINHQCIMLCIITMNSLALV